MTSSSAATNIRETYKTKPVPIYENSFSPLLSAFNRRTEQTRVVLVLQLFILGVEDNAEIY